LPSTIVLFQLPLHLLKWEPNAPLPSTTTSNIMLSSSSSAFYLHMYLDILCASMISNLVNWSSIVVLVSVLASIILQSSSMHGFKTSEKCYYYFCMIETSSIHLFLVGLCITNYNQYFLPLCFSFIPTIFFDVTVLYTFCWLLQWGKHWEASGGASAPSIRTLQPTHHLLSQVHELSSPCSTQSSQWEENCTDREDVRFEVDMALVLSTDEFKWSRSLKHELEEGKKGNKLHISSVGFWVK